MPVLAAAQKQETGVRFFFVNQGEDAAKVQRYLNGAGLDLANVVLDLGTALGREVGSGALPTTLFYSASGRLVDTPSGPSIGRLAGEQISPVPFALKSLK